MREDHQKERPMGGQWAEQQKKGMQKQTEVAKQNQQQGQNDPNRQRQGGAGEPQTSPMEPEKQGGIGGP